MKIKTALPEAALPANNLTIARNKSAVAASSFWMQWAVTLLPLGYLWFRLINNLRLEWSTNPQYSYGSVVPFLCGGLLLRRWHAFKELNHERAEVTPASNRWPFIALCATLAFLYLPTRLVEEATPEWRPIQWALGVEAIGLTLCAVHVGKGWSWMKQMAFPICFFFIAIPWPTIIEVPVIQSLTRVNSAIVVELLGWIGIPAIQHGNLIEVSTGTVGVSEACSGIRSFQTSLMISLFFGEFYRINLARRLLLIPAGFVLAMAFNVCRMSFLTVVAAKKGVDAIAQYHDPAGVTITLICAAGLWGMARLCLKKPTSEGSVPVSGVLPPRVGGQPPISRVRFSSSGLFRFSLGLLLWLVAVEAGAALWYRNVESHLAPSPKWSVIFPTNNPTFQTDSINTDTGYLLRFDEGKQGTWVESDGSRWQASYFNWLPGKVAGYLAKRHTPEICLPASGRELVSGPELAMMKVNGVELPIRSYVFQTDGGALYVFHCRWEAGVNEDAYVTHESARFNLVRGVWAGRGKQGQKVLEIIVSGYADPEQAKAALVRQLQTMIKVETPPPAR
jgi:exosortase